MVFTTMALIAPVPASATGLFKNSFHTETYAKGQKYTVTAAKSFLDSNEEDVTCVTSGSVPGSKAVLEQFEGNTGPNVPLRLRILTLEFKNCTSTSGVSCTATAINTPYKGNLNYTSSSNGILTVSEAIGEPSVRVSCGFGFLQCRFGAEPNLGTIGGNPGKIEANFVPLKMTKEEGFLKCPTSAVWTATYVFVSPTAVYVGA